MLSKLILFASIVLICAECSPQDLNLSPVSGFMQAGPLVYVNPSTVTMTARSGRNFQFSGTGGTPPFTFSMASGPGSITSSGLYTAGNTSGPALVRVRDANGNSGVGTVNLMNVATNGSVLASASDSSGNTFIGGAFTAVYPYLAQRGVMVNPATGIPDLTFDLNSGFDLQVLSSVILPDGSVVLGGNFSYYRGAYYHCLVKLTPTGAVDTKFIVGTAGSAFNGVVTSLVVVGNKIYVGGGFTQYAGVTVNHLAKLDLTTGALDTTFNGTGVGSNQSVASLATDGLSLYIGGSFTTYRAAAANYVAKVDLATGALDTTFDAGGAGFNAPVAALAMSSSGLFAGGTFTTYQGSTANFIAKVNTASGVLDATFDPGGTGFAASSAVYSLLVSGTNLYAGGLFFTYRGSAAHYLAKFDTTNGTLDATFQSGQGTGFNSAVYALAISGSSLYAGGAFVNYQSMPARFLIKMDANTAARDTTYDASQIGFDANVSTLAISTSRLFVGGNFSTTQGSPANAIAKLSSGTGTLDPTFDSGGSGFTGASGYSGTVEALAISGSSLFVSGSYFNYRGSSADYLVKLDTTIGALDTTFYTMQGFAGGEPLALAVSGNSLFAGGYFSTYRGATANYIAKLDLTTGNLDTTFNPSGTGFNSYVHALSVAGSNLFVGGTFTAYRTATANYIAKLDTTSGSLDATFDPTGTGFNGNVQSLAFSGSSIYAGGDFTTYRGTSATRLAKLDSTSGALDTTFTSATGGFDSTVYSLAVLGSSLYPVGYFGAYRVTNSAPRIAKLDLTSGAIDTTFTGTKGGFDGLGQSISTYGSQLYVGGTSLNFQSKPSLHFTVLTTAGAVVP